MIEKLADAANRLFVDLGGIATKDGRVVAGLVNRVSDLEKANAAMLAIIKRLEHVAVPAFCVTCGRQSDNGHFPGCPIADLISELEKGVTP